MSDQMSGKLWHAAVICLGVAGAITFFGAILMGVTGISARPVFYAVAIPQVVLAIILAIWHFKVESDEWKEPK